MANTSRSTQNYALADPIVSGTGVDHHHENAPQQSGYTTESSTHVGSQSREGPSGTSGISQSQGHDSIAAESGRNVSTGPGPAHAAGVGWNHSTDIGGHGSGNPESSQSVVDRLNANVQQSVKESTGASDPHVADTQPKASFGKTLLQGLGLGGDERKTELRE